MTKGVEKHKAMVKPKGWKKQFLLETCKKQFGELVERDRCIILEYRSQEENALASMRVFLTLGQTGRH